MVRGKIEIKRIENVTSRQVTFSKRRKGLLKKAHELSILCDAQVAAIVFSQNGRLYDFASSDMTKIMERYEIYRRESFAAERLQKEQYVQELKREMAIMVNKIDHLQLHCRRVMGQDLDSCSVEELKELTIQIEKSLTIVRSRKPRNVQESDHKSAASCGSGNMDISDVKTDLFIGLPES
ncbi:hypothetical protein CARUB_v10006544mg [Capsella rubella]|uniref:MADS-box domain-containing protein n=1 Tax=Capsella rubella TaxID=81985 RepID=R0F2Y0_9BRAS|nr:hypothetical protein CARUB_v10006544mg [Capsella rubella]